MIAIQHQIIDPTLKTEPCYVDFIMGCLEEEPNLAENDDDDNQFVNDEKNYYSQGDRSIDLHIHNRDKPEQDDDSDIHTDTDEMAAAMFKMNGTEERSPEQCLFGTVADFGRGHTTNRQRHVRRRARTSSSDAKDDADSDQHRASMKKSKKLLDYSLAQTDSQGDVEGVSFVDVVSKRSGRQSGDNSTSPQLMYGETRLEESDDEYL
jgi:hypothetical protein